MKSNALRRILLVRSVEDQDADGAVLTLAEREAATREALRSVPAPTVGGAAGAGDVRAWRVLDARAVQLYERLVQRHPVVTRTVMLESRASQAALAVLVVAFVAGLVLSVLDSRVRIEIVAFPLLGLVVWNLAVYAVLALAAVRRTTRRAPGSAGAAADWVAWPLRWGWRRAAALIRQASFYHRPLAAALRRFSDEWWPLAQPLLALQGKRIFHLGAAAVALGLVTGFYVRGIGLEYRAGWESTFLDPPQVRGLLQVMYAPAVAVTGIALPADDAAVETLHWRGGAGGGPAAPWIHLMAVTALLFVVLPRLLLAAAASVALMQASRSMAVPEALLPYARAVLGGSDAAPAPMAVCVTPYACQPGTAALDGLQRLMHAAYGPGTRVDVAAPVAYGDEAAFGERGTGGTHDLQVVLFSLASTPEAENHGAMLTTASDVAGKGKATTRLLALVDESTFLEHMGGDTSLVARIEERREAWKSFGTRHGWEVCPVDLASFTQESTVPAEVVARLRGSARLAHA